MPQVETHPFGNFCWFDLMAKDLAASTQFYGALFGWGADAQPVDEGGGPYTMFHLDGDPVAGGGQMSPDMLEGGMPSVWNAYVCVEELEPALEKVTAHGGTVIFPPQDIPGAGRLAYFADPEGAVLALWQPKEHYGVGKIDQTHTVCWVELATREIEKAKEFYTSVFGWDDVENPVAPPGAYRTLKNGEADIGGLLQMTEEWGEMPAHWALYFEVEDINASTEKLSELGGDVKFGPFEAPGVGHIAVCADDAGAHFYLMQLSEELKAARD